MNELHEPSTARYVVDSWLSDSVSFVEAAEHTGEIIEHLKFFDEVSKAIAKYRWMRGDDKPDDVDWSFRRLMRRASGYRDRVKRRCRSERRYRI